MKYAIYPPIGIGRVGNSAEYNLSPERMGSLGIEPDDAGPGRAGREATAWKDSDYRVKRLAPRFELFEIPDAGAPRPARLPAAARVTWKVSLANRKDAIRRPDNPPLVPTPSVIDPARADRVISASGSVTGASAAAVDLVGAYPPDVRVPLGRLHTDSKQRLIVLGGMGTAASPTGAAIDQYYTNPGWYDDVSDGPVTAQVRVGQDVIDATPAWVIFGPPDFAPAATSLVTFRDVIRQVAIEQGWETPPPIPSFAMDIRPILERAASLRWVSANPAWKTLSTRWEDLGRKGPEERDLRSRTWATLQQGLGAMPEGALMAWQRAVLEAWVQGGFDADAPPHALGPAAERTRAALDVAAGHALDPGIEAGIVLLSPDHFLQPFDYRIDPSKREAGEMTALMSLPWQADLIDCLDGWWPAQRPGIAPQKNGPDLEWTRPLAPRDYAKIVSRWMQLGMVVMHEGRGLEVGRDPRLDE